MKEIVDKTGLSKGAFYHYFASKEQVFAEVINHFFVDLMADDYSKYSQTSLRDFYTELLARADKNSEKIIKQIAGADAVTIFDTNIYYLLFDAMKMLPGFKQQHHEQQEAELKAWKKIVTTAIENKEINNRLKPKLVAKLFIYLDDGANINLIMNTRKNELKLAWDGLYSLLKI